MRRYLLSVALVLGLGSVAEACQRPMIFAGRARVHERHVQITRSRAGTGLVPRIVRPFALFGVAVPATTCANCPAATVVPTPKVPDPKKK